LKKWSTVNKGLQTKEKKKGKKANPNPAEKVRTKGRSPVFRNYGGGKRSKGRFKRFSIRVSGKEAVESQDGKIHGF